MNMGDTINDFLCDVRERGGFANDRDFDLIVGQVFSEKIKVHIEAEREACAMIADREYVSIQTVTMSDGLPEEGENDCCAERCLIIRDRIRARSEKEE